MSWAEFIHAPPGGSLGTCISADSGKKPPLLDQIALNMGGVSTGFGRFGGKSVLKSKWSKIEAPAAHFLPLRAPQANFFNALVRVF